MDMNFADGLTANFIFVDAQDQMPIHREAVVFLELLAGEVPVGIKPARITGGQQQALGSVGFRQFARFACIAEIVLGRCRSQSVALTWSGLSGLRRGCISLQKDRRDGGLFGRFGAAVCCRCFGIGPLAVSFAVILFHSAAPFRLFCQLSAEMNST